MQVLSSFKGFDQRGLQDLSVHSGLRFIEISKKNLNKETEGWDISPTSNPKPATFDSDPTFYNPPTKFSTLDPILNPVTVNPNSTNPYMGVSENRRP